MKVKKMVKGRKVAKGRKGYSGNYVTYQGKGYKATCKASDLKELNNLINIIEDIKKDLNIK